MDKDSLKNKVINFLHENNYEKLHKGPTDHYQKHTQKKQYNAVAQ
jgi:hypothetical protein